MKNLLFAFLLCSALTSGAQRAFNPDEQPPAPDYSNTKNWAALPFREDAADAIPSSETWVDDSLKQVDVFFIYPTVYFKGKTWTEDINNEKLNAKVDKKPIRYQASVFNKSCRVYAPRYRQARLNAFYNKENGERVLDFAYQDVKRAFLYYMEHYNNGRPIIIASHSQGSRHARRLLAEFFDTTALRNRLVCAYVVGFGIDQKRYKNLKPCKHGNETGCYVTWASYKEGYEPGKTPLYGNVCVNPVSWNMDTIPVDASKSIGCLLLNFDKEYQHACATQIPDNYLWVKTDLPLIRYAKILHVGDYNLFWFDIRQNVKNRVEAFLKK